MINSVFSDLSGSIHVQFAREIGDPIMKGLSAAEFKTRRDEWSKDDLS
jgi:hypothetical protein